jgi:Ulp1 family protease
LATENFDNPPRNIPIVTDSDNDTLVEDFETIKSRALKSRFAILHKCDLNKIREIFSMPTSLHETVLVELYNIPMTVAKLSCLMPNKQLNDEVVNFCQEMNDARDLVLCDRSQSGKKRSHFFSSFFIEILTGPFHMKYDYNNIWRWTRRFDIFALEKLFFPINLVAKSKDEIGHWTGVVIKCSNKAYFIL